MFLFRCLQLPSENIGKFVFWHEETIVSNMNETAENVSFCGMKREREKKTKI